MPVIETIPPRATSIAGLSIRRILPAPARRMLGPFIFMDQGGPTSVASELARGVPEHPHAGLSTFTYLIDGAVQHRDSAGYSATVRAGDIALMTSGRGMTHEELPVADGAAEQRFYFAQMWLALPDALEETEPAFEHHPRSSLPVHETDAAIVRVAMGSAFGLTAPTTCHAPTLFIDILLDADGSIPLELDAEEVGLMILEGDARLGEARLPLHALNVLGPERETLQTKGGCRALVFGGARFPTRRWIGGSFVASSREKLERWMRDSARGDWPRIER